MRHARTGLVTWERPLLLPDSACKIGDNNRWTRIFASINSRSEIKSHELEKETITILKIRNWAELKPKLKQLPLD